jgi:hypothetical protein
MAAGEDGEQQRRRWGLVAVAVVGGVVVGGGVAAPLGWLAARAAWREAVLLPVARAVVPPLTDDDRTRLATWRRGGPAANTSSPLSLSEAAAGPVRPPVAPAPPSSAGGVIVVFWTTWFGAPGLSGQRGPDAADHSAQCPVRCWVDATRGLLPHAHGLLFHARDVRTDDLPPRDAGGWPQPWALLTQETPVNDGWPWQRPELLRLFDYSMTYRRDADFHAGYMADLDLVALARRPLRTPLAYKDADAPIVWIQSNCDANNHREAYVRALMRHVNVHAYGRCLHNRRWPTEPGPPAADGTPTTAPVPVLDLLGKYRFALVAENSDCADYWTEKYKNALGATVVPIVNGPRHKYRPLLPVADAALFMDEHTPAQMAALVLTLSRNDTAYLHLVRYRDGVGVEGAGSPVPLADAYLAYANETQHLTDPFCAFCMRLDGESRAARAYAARAADMVPDAYDDDNHGGLGAHAQPSWSPVRTSAVRADRSCVPGRLAPVPAWGEPDDSTVGPAQDEAPAHYAVLAVVALAIAMALLVAVRGRRAAAALVRAIASSRRTAG